MPITSSSATGSTFHRACTESYRHHLCCCWTWTSWCPPCGQPCAQRTHFQPKLLNRSRKHSSGGFQSPWWGLRVFLHRGPFSDSTQFWLKKKEQLAKAMVGLRKSTFDPVDRQIHCWPSNTLVTVKQFRHTYVRFETPVQRCWWWSVNCDKYDVWWWYFCWKFEVFTQKQATQLMQIIF